MDKLKNLFLKGGLSMDRLRNFCHVAEAGGLTRAAEGDPGRMSLYSRQIKELEAFFGVELTRRVGKTVAITEAGHRLARLARAQFLGLEEFLSECQHLPRTLSIGAGNSVIEWLLMPRIAAVRKALPDTTLGLHTLQTATTVERLEELTLDLGILPDTAPTARLRRTVVTPMAYALFVPKALLGKVSPHDLPSVVRAVPLAASMGGTFRAQVEDAAAKAKLPFRFELGCSSFTQAARAVRTGVLGALLPSTAATDFDPKAVVQIPVPFLKKILRPLCLAWNPRLLDMRPSVEAARDAMVSILRPAA